MAKQSEVAQSGTFKLGGELEVYRLGFGSMQLTGQGVWGEPDDRENAKKVLRLAVDLDINFIDTADSYGPDVAENLIAEALHPYPRNLVIATKGGLVRPGPGRWDRNGNPKHLREALEGSLKRLRLDCIDLYQLHAPDPDVPFEDSVGTLSDLKSEGKIRFIGLSNVDIEHIERARAVTDIVSVQNEYNFDDRSCDPVIDYCESEGLGFIPWFPLNTGRIGDQETALDRVAKRHQATAKQIALAWLLARSPCVLPIPGTSKMDHLRDNVHAATLRLTDEDKADLGLTAQKPAGKKTGQRVTKEETTPKGL